MMAETLSPTVETNNRESTLVTEYRKQLMTFNGSVEDFSTLQTALESTVILKSLINKESPMSLSTVLGDILFNTVMMMDSLKSGLDIAFEHLDQRVTVFLVSPDFDLGLKEREKVCKTLYLFLAHVSYKTKYRNFIFQNTCL